MNSFWQILLPALLPALLLFVLYQLYRSHTLTRRLTAEIDANVRLRRELAAERSAAAELRARLAEVHSEAQRLYAQALAARETITGLERQLEGRDTDAKRAAELYAARQRVAYLVERNNQLTLEALANAGKLIKYYDC